MVVVDHGSGWSWSWWLVMVIVVVGLRGGGCGG